MSEQISYIDKVAIQTLISKMPVSEIADLMNISLPAAKEYAEEYCKTNNIKSIEVMARKKKEAKKLKQAKENHRSNYSFAPKKEHRNIRVLATKQIDFSQMVPLKVDHKTTIYVPRDCDKLAEIRKYQTRVAEQKQREEETWKKNRPVKRVSKFKASLLEA